MATEDVVLAGLVSLLGAYQMATGARRVGAARRKFKIEPPATDGDPEFVRTFRAQENNIEFFPMFLVGMWLSAIFFHQVPAAIAGVIYLYARQQYFNNYIQEAQKRVGPFKLSATMLRVLLLMSLLGLANSLAKYLLDVDLKLTVLNLYYGTK